MGIRRDPHGFADEACSGLVPKKGDSDKTIQTKLNNLTDFMNQQSKGSLLAEGITYNPDPVDLFSPQSLASIIWWTRHVDELTARQSVRYAAVVT